MFLLVERNESPKQYSIINISRVKKARIDGKEFTTFVGAEFKPGVEVSVSWYRSTFWAMIISTGDKQSLKQKLEEISVDHEIGSNSVSKRKAVTPELLPQPFETQLKKNVHKNLDQTQSSGYSTDANSDPDQTNRGSPNRENKRNRSKSDHNGYMRKMREDLSLLENKLRKILITVGFERDMVKSRRQIDEACCELLQMFSYDFQKAIPEYVTTKISQSIGDLKSRNLRSGLGSSGNVLTAVRWSPVRSRHSSSSSYNSSDSSNSRQTIGIDCSPNSLIDENTCQQSVPSSLYGIRVQATRTESSPGISSPLTSTPSPTRRSNSDQAITEPSIQGSAVFAPVTSIGYLDGLLHTEAYSFAAIPHCKADSTPIVSFALNNDALEPQRSGTDSGTPFDDDLSPDRSRRASSECSQAETIAHSIQEINPLLFEAPDNPLWATGELSSLAISHPSMNPSGTHSSQGGLKASAHTEFSKGNNGAMTFVSEATPLNACNNNRQTQHGQIATATWREMSQRYDDGISAHSWDSDDAQMHFAHENHYGMTYELPFRQPGTVGDAKQATKSQIASSGCFGSYSDAHSSTPFSILEANQREHDYNSMLDCSGAVNKPSLTSTVESKGNSAALIAALRAGIDGTDTCRGGNNNTDSSDNIVCDNISGNKWNDGDNSMDNNSNSNSDHSESNKVNRNSKPSDTVQPDATPHTNCDSGALKALSGSEVSAFFDALSSCATTTEYNFSDFKQVDDIATLSGAVNASDVLTSATEAPLLSPTIQSRITAAAEGCKSYGTAILSQTATVLHKAITENDLYKKCRCCLLVDCQTVKRCCLLSEDQTTRKWNPAIAGSMQPDRSWYSLDGNENEPVDIFTFV